MVRMQAQLTEDQINALRPLAAETGKSIADLIRQGVDLLLARHRPVNDRQRMERAIGVVGKFSSGSPDVSEQHDRYLAEALSE